MILGANIRALGSHLAGWRHPKAWPKTVMNLQNSIEMAKMVEAAKLHFIFLADGNGVRGMDQPKLFAATAPSDRPAVFEPVTLLSVIATVTKHVGLVATATTTYEEPFLVARKFAVARPHQWWPCRLESRYNLQCRGQSELQPDGPHGPGRALRSSDGIRLCRARAVGQLGRGCLPRRQDSRAIPEARSGPRLDHKGKHFSVRGPLNVARPPQGHPLIFCAGQSEAGKELAASTADCLFATGTSKEQSRGIYTDIKGRLSKYGRRKQDLKILPGLLIYVGETAQEAEDYYQGLQAMIPPDLGIEYLSKTLEMDLSGYPIDGPVPQLIGEKVGGIATRFLMAEYAHRNNLTIKQTYEHVVGSMGGLIIKGSVGDVCDQMEDWYRSEVCDGFVLSGPVMPDGMYRILRMVVPELQRRGVFRKNFEDGKTFRESIGLERPKNRFFDV